MDISGVPGGLFLPYHLKSRKFKGTKILITPPESSYEKIVEKLEHKGLIDHYFEHDYVISRLRKTLEKESIAN